MIHFCYTTAMLKTKKRINISVSADTNQELIKLAERDQVPVASKALDLIKKAIQIEEDEVLDLLAQQRDIKNAKYSSHEQVWR